MALLFARATILRRTTPCVPPRRFTASFVTVESARSEVTFKDALTNLGFTENMGVTHKSSLNVKLDLFFQLLPSTPAEKAFCLFEQSWNESPEETLRLIFHAGSIREGKSDKSSFLHGLYWLAKKHPQTLLANLKHVPSFGYWKDLLYLLARLNLGEEAWGAPKVTENTRWLGITEENGFANKKIYRNADHRKKARTEKRAEWRQFLKSLPDQKSKDVAKNVKEEWNKTVEVKEIERIKAAKKLRNEANVLRTNEVLASNQVYQRVQNEVVRLFSDQLQADLDHLNSAGESSQISLAAKWAPSAKLSFDRIYQITPLIAQRLFPEEKYRQIANGILGPKKEYVSKVVNLLRKQYLSPLRKNLDLPEICMSANQWDQINYPRISSVCMKNSAEIFLKHDNKRFLGYLTDVEVGKAKISSATLLPHDLIAKVCAQNTNSEVEKVYELQWNSYVNSLRAAGTLSSCLPVCDVSGSMECSNGLPGSTTNRDVAIALSLLASSLADEPFHNLICTFSKEPSLEVIKEGTLRQRAEQVSKMNWAGNTNFQAVFDLILKRAQLFKLTNEQMVKRIIVFSDMQFDQACPKSEQTDHMILKDKFAAAGYSMPEIVYWNLNGTYDSGTPVTQHDEGVALISGVSGQMLKLFLAGEDLVGEEASAEVKKLDPIEVMNKAIFKPCFDVLQVVD